MSFDPTTGLPVGTTVAPTGIPGALTINMPTPTPPVPPVSRQFTAEELEALVNAERERVRKEEKDKLYPVIETLQTSVAELTRDRDERLALETQAQQAASEVERLRLEAEMSATQRIEATLQDQNARFAAIEAERDMERALREREVEYNRVLQYRTRRAGEEQENILPQLLDTIAGNSEQEIEDSIARARTKSEEIFAEAQARFGQQQTPVRRVPLPVSGAPAFDPNELTGGTQQQTLTAQDIREMDLSDYAANRDILLRAGSEHVRQHGVYGQ